MKIKEDILILADTFDLYSPTTRLLGNNLERILKNDFNIKTVNYKDIMGNYPHNTILKIPIDLIARFIKSFKLIKYLNNKKYKKIILIDNGFLSLLYVIPFILSRSKNKEIIVFKYDLVFGIYNKNLDLKNKVGAYISTKVEKFFLIKADKIIHKGLSTELELYPYYEKIKDKPHYLFREFIDKKLIKVYDSRTKLSYKDKDIHIVHVGGIRLEHDHFNQSIFEMASWIAKEGIHLHVYSRIDKLFEDRLRKLESENKYFHFEGFLDHKDMMVELQKYDYGSYLVTPFSKESSNEILVKTATGNKMFDYISAKLPIICIDNMLAMVEFIDEYKVGFYISKKEVRYFSKILKERTKQYPEMINNINKTILKLTDTKEFVQFIKK